MHLILNPVRFRALFAGMAFLFSFHTLRADEGMWPPPLLSQALFDQMRAKGFLLSPEDVYSTSKASLKDAVVLFGRGCTGEIISNQGLILTNHHCGFGQIQQHSSVEHDYLKDGFWAKTMKDELPNPGLTVSLLVRMEDVTQAVNEGITPEMPAAEKAKKLDANSKKIVASFTQGTHYQGQIRPFFGGLQQWILVYETFTDIRLVGAPPSSIGKFGGDTDNWVWPRHTGDFSLFRIYAGKDNKPAPYSAENVPYTPKKFFSVSMSGIKEGDFTMILGYPGRTMEYLPSYALDLVNTVTNPKKIALRTQRLNVINAAMKASDVNRIKYASTQADIANAWKKWKGETLGMTKVDAVLRKQEKEERYRKFFAARGESGKRFLDALESLKSGYEKMRRLSIPAQYQGEAVQANDVFGLVSLTEALLHPDPKKPMDPEQRFKEYQGNIRSIWKDVDPAVERELFKVTLSAYRKDIPDDMHSTELLSLLNQYPIEGGKFQAQFFDKGQWFDSVQVWKLARKVQKGDSAVLQKNPTWKLYSILNKQFTTVFLPQYQKVAAELEQAQQIFFTGLMEMDKDKAFYPDANSTFRIAFGQVAGYQPQDGVKYGWQTTTKGIMEKADTESDFILEPKLKYLYNMQNFSPTGPVPVAFIASNHSTGGNSGSPVLNARGELLGVNFDRVWEGTMSDYYFDSRICRNITCDIRYIIWVIDNVGQCRRLVSEMDLKAN